MQNAAAQEVPPTITDDAIRRAARAELVSAESVVRVLAGLRVRGLAGVRARRAAERLRSGAR